MLLKKIKKNNSAIAKNLDKASVIRMTISFLRMTKFAEKNSGNWNFDFSKNDNFPASKQQRLKINTKVAMDTLKVWVLTYTVFPNVSDDFPGMIVR